MLSVTHREAEVPPAPGQRPPVTLLSPCLSRRLSRCLSLTEKLKFRPPPVNARLELGSVARVYCSADGEDTPAVRWVRGPNPRAAPNLPPHAAIIERGTLVFDRVRPTDAGVYTCVATSGQGSINKTIELEVVGKSPSAPLGHPPTPPLYKTPAPTR